MYPAVSLINEEKAYGWGKHGKYLSGFLPLPSQKHHYEVFPDNGQNCTDEDGRDKGPPGVITVYQNDDPKERMKLQRKGGAQCGCSYVSIAWTLSFQ